LIWNSIPSSRGRFSIATSSRSTSIVPARELLVRIPGIGVRNVDRIVAARRYARLHLMDLQRMRISLKKVLPFIITADHVPKVALLENDQLRQHFLPPPKQMELELRRAACHSCRCGDGTHG